MAARGLTMEPALPGDEPALRRLLRETPFAGAVSLSLEREPDFNLAAAVEGDRHDVVVARAPDGGVAGLASRSVRTAFVNGAPARLGYLGQLRAGPAGRGHPRAQRDGFALLRAARRPGELPFDLTCIVSDNRPARRLLEAGLPGFPTYRPLGELTTLALVARTGRVAGPARADLGDGDGDGGGPGAGALRVVRATPERLAEVAALLAEDGPRRQFAPCLAPADLGSPDRTRGLAAADFLLADRGGRLAGCAAVWDQRAFKQAVVRGYAPLLALARPLLSLVGRPLGLPRLPPVGTPLAAAFLAFLAVRDDDAAVLDALLDAALAEAAARGLDTLLLGLAAGHPLLAVARRRRHRPYRSTLYAVHFDDGAAAAAALDGRTLGPEAATL